MSSEGCVADAVVGVRVVVFVEGVGIEFAPAAFAAVVVFAVGRVASGVETCGGDAVVEPAVALAAAVGWIETTVDRCGGCSDCNRDH